MEEHTLSNPVLFENRFWLQIMGDHARFVLLSLAPAEAEFIRISHEYIIQYDQLLEYFREVSPTLDIAYLQGQALQLTLQFRGFLLQLLAMTLNSNLKSGLTSSFYNNMLNESDEYLKVINALTLEKPPVFHPVHYHLLWLMDAYLHADIIKSQLDSTEKDKQERLCQFETIFQTLHTKAITLHGFLRTQLNSFPSLDRLNEQVTQAMTGFIELLESLRDQRLDGRILGSLTPLLTDHMAREGCYYLWKLWQSSKDMRKPDNDPLRPRVEN